MSNPRPPKDIAFIDVVFDGPPGPDGPRFIECEDQNGKSVGSDQLVVSEDGLWTIKAPAWVKRNDGYWALRFESITYD